MEGFKQITEILTFVIKTTAFLSDKLYFSSNYSETHRRAQFICKVDHSK